MTASGGRSRRVGGLDFSLSNIALARVLGLPMIFWYGVVLVAVFAYVMGATPLGRHILFVGANREVAPLAGIPVTCVRVGAWLTSALLSGLAGDVTISSHDGTLAVMQMLKSGKFVGSEIGFNADALAWYGADQALRLMVCRPANPMVEFPYVRMFNAANVGDLDLTPEAEKSGAWYGSTDYQDGFHGLWGLDG